jgi:putative glutamine amidotransferase
MKKILATLLVLVMALSLIGCATTAQTQPETETAQAPETDTLETDTAAAQDEQAPEENDTVRVGIAWLADFEDGQVDEDTQAYLDAIAVAGGEAVLLPQATDATSADEALAMVDCIIMTGGEDIDPSLYGQEADEMLEEINTARDTSDYWMITEALAQDVPMLATCRGMQMLNVVCGGTLIQDIPTQYSTEVSHRDPELEDFAYHTITVEADSLLSEIMADTLGEDMQLEVNSWHHQGVETVGEGLVVTSYADDGLVESLEIPGTTFVMGVQFHPEWFVEDGDLAYLPFFLRLMEAAK